MPPFMSSLNAFSKTILIFSLRSMANLIVCNTVTLLIKGMYSENL